MHNKNTKYLRIPSQSRLIDLTKYERIITYITEEEYIHIYNIYNRYNIYNIYISYMYKINNRRIITE